MCCRFLFVSLVLFLGCRPDTGHITIGDYRVDLSDSFKVEKGKAFNTETGIIKGKGITLHYEFSNHTQPPVLTPQEFMEQGEWRPIVARDLFNKGLKEIHKIEFLSTRPAGSNDSATYKGCDYIVSCRYDSLSFELPVYLPKETKQSRFLVDTFDNVYRKLFLAADLRDGETGIYLKRITPDAMRTNNVYALSITTTNVTKAQQDTLLKFFRGIKLFALK